MAPGGFRFEQFCLDLHDRRLSRDGAPVELNARYLDALALLVREQGRLVSKDRFLEEVWRGVPVTDEALTQCIRTLRRQLGDDAARPRFIETVPKHGYRFIAPVFIAPVSIVPVEGIDAGPAPETPVANSPAPDASAWRRSLPLGIAGTLGGGVAGVIGGLIYGFVGAAQSLQGGTGGLSALLVLVWLITLVALLGGAGVGFGIAAAGALKGRVGPWSPVGGAIGGLIVGGAVNMIGLDAFSLLFGHAPGGMTGAPEGAVLGGAVGLAAWLGTVGAETPRLRRGFITGGLAGAGAGLLITLLGGSLMGGSLDRLTQGFPDSRLTLDALGPLFGESGFGPLSHMATAGLEGLLFGACVVAAMIVARRRGFLTSRA